MRSTDEDNELLEAIKALQYEGTKADVLQNFKDQGNDMVKTKRWSDAKEFYTKGVAVLTSTSDEKWDKVEDPEEEASKLKILEEQIYVNRALCNLELSEPCCSVFSITADVTRELSIDYPRLRRCATGQPK